MSDLDIVSYGTNVVFNGTVFERGCEWIRYDSIGDRISRVTNPLKTLFPNFPASKLNDLDDIISQNKDTQDIVYFVHAILNEDNKYREDMVDIILNIIYPKTKNIMHYTHRLFEFFKYCEENKFSSKERMIAMEQMIDGKNLYDIKFEKIDNQETIDLINKVMQDVNLDDVRRKPALVNYYVGQVMQMSKGKAPVSLVKTTIEKMIKVENDAEN